MRDESVVSGRRDDLVKAVSEVRDAGKGRISERHRKTLVAAGRGRYQWRMHHVHENRIKFITFTIAFSVCKSASLAEG